jgi:hypothetical protein
MSSEPVRQRSPRAPAFGLGQAIERALLVYASEGLNVIPTSAAVKAMGFNSMSGAAKRAVATLKGFGLLEQRGDGAYSVSRALQAYKLAPDDDTRRYHALEFLAQPELYASLLMRYAEQLPSNETLTHHLVVELGFLESAAKDVIKAFRESVEFAGYTSPSGGKVAPIGTATETSQAMPVRVITGAVGLQAGPAQVSSSGVVTTHSSPSAQAALDSTTYDDAIPIRLRGGRKAWLTLPKPFREVDKATLVAAIQSIVADDEES